MWECPDLFTLGADTFLICCPQGVAREAHRFLNTHPSAYLSGAFTPEQATFEHGALHELDAGFEFYAPQTTLSADGRRLLVGWMGVPDGEEMRQPTVAQGWIHQMTCVRELSNRNGKLYQQPVRELQALRENERRFAGRVDDAPVMDARSLELWVESEGELTLNIGDTLILHWHKDHLRLDRRSLENGEWLSRYWDGEANVLQILCDSSSVEIFINEGAGVMSSRYFPSHPAQITFSGSGELRAQYWSLRPCMVE
jgi:beta-fructofuranosidase